MCSQPAARCICGLKPLCVPRRCFDATQWHEHRKQAEGLYGTRIELGDKLVKRTYYALMCSRTRMYLCSSDRKWFRGTSEPGALLRRGWHPAMDGEVRSGLRACRTACAIRCASLSKLSTWRAGALHLLALAARQHRLRRLPRLAAISTISVRLQDTPAAREAPPTFEDRTVRSAVRHVVLAVHGIGQRMGGRTIAEDARDVRDGVNGLLDSHMANEVGRGFIQVLPVQWRKNLDLEVSLGLPLLLRT